MKILLYFAFFFYIKLRIVLGTREIKITPSKEGKDFLAQIFNLRFNEVIRTLVIYSLEHDERWGMVK